MRFRELMPLTHKLLPENFTLNGQSDTNTNSLAKEFSKILIIIFEYFGYLQIGSDVFFNADSESPFMTKGKNATLRSYG